MCEELARYFAGRYAALYQGETESPDSDLLAAFHRRGVLVVNRPRLGEAGFFNDCPFPHVVLGRLAGTRVKAHELWHAWLYDNIEHGISYACPEADEERLAEVFSELVAGEEA